MHPFLYSQTPPTHTHTTTFLIVISNAGMSTVGNVNVVDGFLGSDSLKWNYCHSSFPSFSKSYNMVIIFPCTYKVINQQSKIAQEPSGIEVFWKLSQFLSQYFIYLNLTLFPRKFSLHLDFLMYLHKTVYNLLCNYLNLHICDYMDFSFYSHGSIFSSWLNFLRIYFVFAKHHLVLDLLINSTLLSSNF